MQLGLKISRVEPNMYELGSTQLKLVWLETRVRLILSLRTTRLNL